MTFHIVCSRTNSGRWQWLILALFVLAPPCRFASAEPLPQDLAERKLAQLLEWTEDTSERIENLVSSNLLKTDWPDNLMPKVLAMLSKILEQPDRELKVYAVRVFAERNGADAAFLVPYIAATLPKLDRTQTIDWLRALRAIGPPAKSLEEVLNPMLQDTRPVVVMHAASALVRMAPPNRYARGKLLGYLLSKDPGLRWRAADAMAHAPVSDQRWLALLKDDNICVRVTSAYALWRITDDAKVSLPVLLASLAEDDTSLSTAFVYPSFRGHSHRVYALQAIMGMGAVGKSAIPDIVLVVKDVASAETPTSSPYAIVGVTALNAIVELGPITETEFKEIEESVGCDACAFTLAQDQAQESLALIRRRSD